MATLRVTPSQPSQFSDQTLDTLISHGDNHTPHHILTYQFFLLNLVESIICYDMRYEIVNRNDWHQRENYFLEINFFTVWFVVIRRRIVSWLCCWLSMAGDISVWILIIIDIL